MFALHAGACMSPGGDWGSSFHGLAAEAVALLLVLACTSTMVSSKPRKPLVPITAVGIPHRPAFNACPCLQA